MRKIYKGDIPRNVKKAFAERLRQARIKGETNTAEYKRVMVLRAKGEITLDIAQNAIRKRKRKVSHETLTAREKMETRKQKWIESGLEYSNEFQKMLKRVDSATDSELDNLFYNVRGYDEKKLRLNSLLEEHKEYIYEGATNGNNVDVALFEDIMNGAESHRMFGKSIDEYIGKLELYGKNKTELLNKYLRDRKK